MRLVGKRVSLSVALGLAAVAFAATFAIAGPASAAEILSVKNESANFRDGPGDKHAIVYSADKFYPVEIVEKKDGWAKVKDFEGDVAWVAERLLAKQETVVVEGDKVNVREKPNTTSEIAFKSERGEVFKVESHQGKWLKVVDANGDGGWIRDDMVWGEREPAAAAPKGKTKGEIEDPAAKPGVAPAADKPADKTADKAAGKPKADKADKPESKPKDGKARPAEGDDKAKAGADKAEDKAEDAKSDDRADDGKANEKADDGKASEKANDKADDAKANDKADDAG